MDTLIKPRTAVIGIVLLLVALPMVLLGRFGLSLVSGIAMYLSIPIMVWFIIQCVKFRRSGELCVSLVWMSICTLIAYFFVVVCFIGAGVARPFTAMYADCPFVGAYMVLLIVLLRSAGFPAPMKRSVRILVVCTTIFAVHEAMRLVFP